jgi:dUTPase
MKVKVFEKTPGCMPEVFEVGDWIDLKSGVDIRLYGPKANRLHRYNRSKEDVPEERFREVDFHDAVIPLGVCIQVPKGYECILAPRSSAFKKYGIIQVNSIGVIDQTYCSEEDEWMMHVVGTRKVIIPKGTRIAQFRVQLSQNATAWQKIKHLFSPKVKLVKVEHLNNPVRGGFGSTNN